MDGIELKTVIFDMDGLMFDTERLSYEKMCETLPLFGYEMAEEILHHTIGVNRRAAIGEFRAYFGADFPAEEIFAKRRTFVDHHIDVHGVPVKKGLVELLDFLRDQSITTVVATSSHRSVAARLLRIADVVDRIGIMVCGDEIACSKPDPEIFLKALDKTDTHPEEAFVLEDSRMGILAASRVGIRSIMVPDIYPPDKMTCGLYFKEFPDLFRVRDYLVDALGIHCKNTVGRHDGGISDK